MDLESRYQFPQLYEYSTYRKEEDEYNITSCGAHGIVENFETVYACVAIVLSYAVPLIIITICYFKIMRYVWKVGKTSSENDIQVLKRMKVVKILLLITIVFILLWSPFFVLFGMEVSHLYWMCRIFHFWQNGRMGSCGIFDNKINIQQRLKNKSEIF